MSAVAFEADVLAVGMVTPVGLDAASAAAAVRAGVSRARETSVCDKDRAPFRMAIVADDHLPQLAPPLAARAGVTYVHARLLRLCGSALQQASTIAPSSPAPLFLGVPEVRRGERDPVGGSFLPDLAIQAGATFDARASKLHREGGAAGLFALDAALGHLQAARADCVLVGGADTFLDLGRLAALDAEDRILGERVMDGFVPGEGAAVLLLTKPEVAQRLGARPLARVVAAATGSEAGHRYGDAPYRGEGLAAVFQELFAAAPSAPPVRCVYAGFNGESLPGKEWGVALLRSASRFTHDPAIEHPADCLGDCGAAAGPIMLGLAAVGLARGYRRDPILVWCTSDRAPRAAALLRSAP